MVLDRIAMVLVIIGAVVWGVVGIFGLNPITWVFGSSMGAISRIVYILVAAAGVWCIHLLFREREVSISKDHE